MNLLQLAASVRRLRRQVRKYHRVLNAGAAPDAEVAARWLRWARDMASNANRKVAQLQKLKRRRPAQ